MSGSMVLTSILSKRKFSTIDRSMKRDSARIDVPQNTMFIMTRDTIKNRIVMTPPLFMKSVTL